jgi:thiol-disulfide isomerase/thioredoxin
LLATCGGIGATCWASCAAAPEAGETAETVTPDALLSGLTDFDGAAVPAPKVLGRVTLVDFWASWCAPCRQAFRHLDQLYRTYAADGLNLMAVCVDDNAIDGRRFWAAARPRFPVAWDATGRVRQRFGVATLPTTVLLDENGFLVQRNEGFDPAQHRILEEHLHRLIRV